MNKMLDAQTLDAQTLDQLARDFKNRIEAWPGRGLGLEFVLPAIQLQSALEDYAKAVEVNEEEIAAGRKAITSQEELRTKLAASIERYRGDIAEYTDVPAEVTETLTRIDTGLVNLDFGFENDLSVQAAPDVDVMDDVLKLRETLLKHADPVGYVYKDMLSVYGHAETLLGLIAHENWQTEHAATASIISDLYDRANSDPLPQDEDSALQMLHERFAATPKPFNATPELNTLGDAYQVLLAEVKDLQVTSVSQEDGYTRWITRDGKRTYKFTPEQVEQIHQSISALEDSIETAALVTDGIPSVNHYLNQTLATGEEYKLAASPSFQPLGSIEDAWKKLNLTPAERVYISEACIALGVHPDANDKAEAFSIAVYDAFMDASELQSAPLAISAGHEDAIAGLKNSSDTLAYLESIEGSMTLGSLHALGQALIANPALMPDVEAQPELLLENEAPAQEVPATAPLAEEVATDSARDAIIAQNMEDNTLLGKMAAQRDQLLGYLRDGGAKVTDAEGYRVIDALFDRIKGEENAMQIMTALETARLADAAIALAPKPRKYVRLLAKQTPQVMQATQLRKELLESADLMDYHAAAEGNQHADGRKFRQAQARLDNALASLGIIGAELATVELPQAEASQAPAPQQSEPVAVAPLPERMAIPVQPIPENVAEARENLLNSLAVFRDRASHVPGQLQDNELALLYVDALEKLTVPAETPADLDGLAAQRENLNIAYYVDSMAEQVAKANRKEKNEDRRALWTDVLHAQADMHDRMREYFLQQSRENPAFQASLQNQRDVLLPLLMNGGNKLTETDAEGVLGLLTYRIEGEQDGVRILKALELAQKADEAIAAAQKPKAYAKLLAKQEPQLAQAMALRSQMLEAADGVDYYDPNIDNNRNASQKKFAQNENRLAAALSSLADIGRATANADIILPEEKAKPAGWLRGTLGKIFTRNSQPKTRIEPFLGSHNAMQDAIAAELAEPVLTGGPLAAEQPLPNEDDLPRFLRRGRPLSAANAEAEGEPLPLNNITADPEDRLGALERVTNGKPRVKIGDRIRNSKAALLLGKGGTIATAAATNLRQRGVIIGVGSAISMTARYGAGLAVGAGLGTMTGLATAPVVAAGAIIGGAIVMLGVGAAAGATTARMNILFDENRAAGETVTRSTINALQHTAADLFTGALLSQALDSTKGLPALLARAYSDVRKADGENEKQSRASKVWRKSTRWVRTLGKAHELDAAGLRMGLNTVFGGLGASAAFLISHADAIANGFSNGTPAGTSQGMAEEAANRAGKGDRLPVAPVTTDQPAPAAVTGGEQPAAATTDQPAVTPRTETPVVTPQDQQPRVTAPAQAPAIADTIAAATTDAGRIRALIQLPEMQEAMAKLSPAQQRHFGTLIRNATQRGSFTALNDLIDNISEGGRMNGNTFTRIPGLRPDRATAIALRQMIQDKLGGVTFENNGYARALALNNDHLNAMEGRPSRVGEWVANNPRPRVQATPQPRVVPPAPAAGVADPSLPAPGTDPIGDLIQERLRPGGDSTAGAGDIAPEQRGSRTLGARLNGIVNDVFGGRANPGVTNGDAAAGVTATATPTFTHAWIGNFRTSLHDYFVAINGNATAGGYSGMSEAQFNTMLQGADRGDAGAMRHLRSWSKSVAGYPGLTEEQKSLLRRASRLGIPTGPRARI